MKKVLLTEPIHPAGRTILAARGDIEIVETGGISTEHVLEKIADAHAVFVRLARLDEPVLSAAENLELVSRHGVGCELCHGMSDTHSEDEDSLVPPEIMYPKAAITPFCMDCHKKGDLVQEENHEGLFSDKPVQDKSCSECHGKKHRLKVRTRKWDKATGKLTWYDGVRMMEVRPKEDK